MSDVERLLAEAEAHPVEGWDFSWLGERMQIAPLPWSFDEIAATHAETSPDLLDMETGGGEWLTGLRVRPARTVATEAWPPNIGVARTRLEPLGITVVQDEGAPENVEQSEHETRGGLPFPAESFALISNRHGAFVPSELARVLVRGGVFLTEQVGGDYDEFYDTLGLPRPSGRGREWTRQRATTQLERAGLHVTDAAEAREATSFADVGAFAWYLKAIPWVVRDFTVAAYRTQLERVQARIDKEGALTVRQPAFWLRAEKPR